MSDVKRWNISLNKHGEPGAYQSEHGRYVLASDYAALEAENTDLRLQCGGMQMTIDELEAELAKLRAVQEPVAMLCEDVSEFGTVEYFEVLKRIEPGTKLYTIPQPSAVPVEAAKGGCDCSGLCKQRGLASDEVGTDCKAVYGAQQEGGKV